MQIKNPNVVRVFFALWPEAETQQRLHALTMQYQPLCEARAMRMDSLHMTLLFMGNLERSRLPSMMVAADKVSFPAFDFTLERISFWQHNHIGYAASGVEVPALTRLHEILAQALRGAGFEFEHRAFTPHVTLLRKVGHALEAQIITPLRWRVESFVLVESVMSDQGMRYQMLRRWPLAGAVV